MKDFFKFSNVPKCFAWIKKTEFDTEIDSLLMRISIIGGECGLQYYTDSLDQQQCHQQHDDDHHHQG